MQYEVLTGNRFASAPKGLRHHRIVAVIPKLVREDQPSCKTVVKLTNTSGQGEPVHLRQVDITCQDPAWTVATEAAVFPTLSGKGSTLQRPTVRTPTKLRSAARSFNLFLPRVSRRTALTEWVPPPPASHMKPGPLPKHSAQDKPVSGFLSSPHCGKIWLFRGRAKSKSCTY